MFGNDENTKAKHIGEFAKSLVAIEECIQPFKDQLKDLKGNYVQNGWLTKQDISMTVKAIRMMKNDVDLEQLGDFIERVTEALKEEE
tara:strand:- start:943 stop:1203 length:261 start_codon:yes stop_codon:yes gene_type:complete